MKLLYIILKLANNMSGVLNVLTILGVKLFGARRGHCSVTLLDDAVLLVKGRMTGVG